MRAGQLLAIGLLACFSLEAESSLAEDAKVLSVEFNDLQPADDGGCRAVFVIHNGLAKEIESLTLRVVGFDAEEHATMFLSLDVGALPINKTRVLRFDLGTDAQCPGISRFVLDDVAQCAGEGLRPNSCLSVVKLISRANVPFDF